MDDVDPRVAGAGLERAGGCPFVNLNDPRCGTRFSLGRIDQAFSVCFGAYHACPMYQRIRREQAESETRRAVGVELTVITREPLRGPRLPLRPTGT